MSKLVKIHLLLVLLMYIAYILFSFIYDRTFSDDTYKVILYYAILSTILFLLNLIKRAWLKWLVFVLALIIPLSGFYFLGTNPNNHDSINLLIGLSNGNVPFLPDFFLSIESYYLRVFMVYFCYFILPLCYWYGLYILSKRIVNRFFHKKSTHKSWYSKNEKCNIKTTLTLVFRLPRFIE